MKLEILALPGKFLTRRTVIFCHDLVMVSLAWLLAFLLRFDLVLTPQIWRVLLTTLPFVLVVQASVQWGLGLYRGLWRFASIPDLWNILRAALFGVLGTSSLLFLFNRLDGVPRTTLALYPIILIFLLGAPRFAKRVLKDRKLNLANGFGGRRVLILGAGRAGEMLARDMRGKHEYKLVGFADDDYGLKGAKVQGLSVLGNFEDIPAISERCGVDLAIIAIPSASADQMRRVLRFCEHANVTVRTLPRLLDLLSGNATFGDLKQVSIEDLLGREPVTLDLSQIQGSLKGKVAMVTGGGGSIGSELCRQIARMNPERLVIFERNEFNIYSVQMEIEKAFPHLSLTALLGDVCDPISADRTLAEYKPDLIFHAAAYKHVPMLEENIREAVNNNVRGTRVMVEAAIRHKCGTFVMVSTDKAVNPTNIMGTTKRLAEVICQNSNSQSKTKFVTVRFGNVLGSAGSVVPLFRKQIEDGGPVTVTHPDITRYFMTIREACLLILQSAVIGNGGEIFVLDMGEPIRIMDLADQMIRLSGKLPGEDISIEITGLRPGEKLFEEFFYQHEDPQITGQDKILLARQFEMDWDELNIAIDQLVRACRENDEQAIRVLLDSVMEFPGMRGPAKMVKREGVA